MFHVNGAGGGVLVGNSKRKLEGRPSKDIAERPMDFSGVKKCHGISTSLPVGLSSGTPPKCPDNRVIINVGGIRYETFRTTLRNVPDTRLSWITETNSQSSDYDPVTGEYFFDRHPGIFLMILNYYRTGKLHAPSELCGPIFEEELEFWGIDEKQIEPCCWMNYISHKEAQKTLIELDGKDHDDQLDEEDVENVARIFGIEEAEPRNVPFWERFQPKIWSALEDPYSSRVAKVITAISLLFVIVSITAFCVETVCSARVWINETEAMALNLTLCPSFIADARLIRDMTRPADSLKYIEYICIAYFTLELLLRIIFCPDKCDFCKQIINWIDLLAILPFYIELIVKGANSTVTDNDDGLVFLKAFRMVRIFRIFKLTRHFSGIKILVHTLKASARELVLLIVILMLSVLIFGVLIFYIELLGEDIKNPSYFWNIPRGFWWAVVTMTTLGYGDMYPKTGYGYIIGTLCAMCGVLMIALPVPVIVNNFAMYYTHAQAKLKLPKKKKNVFVGFADTLRNGGVPDDVYQGTIRSSSPDGASAESAKALVDRKDSQDSCIDSMDNSPGYAASGESTGISVTFTDELTDNDPRPLPRAPSSPPPRRPTDRRSSLLPNGRVLGGEPKKANGHIHKGRRSNLLQMPEVGV